MKLIFLDIDGVLNRNCVAYLPDDAPRHYYEPACVARLNRIIEATDAELVLSSSWRLTDGHRMEELVRHWGVQPGRTGAVFIGITSEAPAEYAGARARGAEIAMWLDNNGCTAARYVALDDYDLAPWVRARLIDPMKGITANDAEAVIAYLNRQTETV